MAFWFSEAKPVCILQPTRRFSGSKWNRYLVCTQSQKILVRRVFNDSKAAPAGPIFLLLPMNVMEEITDAAAGEPSYMDYTPTVGSLDLLAKQLASISLGKLAIIAGDEVYWSGAAKEVLKLAEIFGATVYALHGLCACGANFA